MTDEKMREALLRESLQAIENYARANSASGHGYLDGLLNRLRAALSTKQEAEGECGAGAAFNDALERTAQVADDFAREIRALKRQEQEGASEALSEARSADTRPSPNAREAMSEPKGPLTEDEIMQAAALAGFMKDKRAASFLLRLIGEVRRHRFGRRMGRKAREEATNAAAALIAALDAEGKGENGNEPST
jgi:hypothetical protein